MTEFPSGSIRARAPLRLGFAGGGTDLSPYCEEFGGAVLNFTVDRFAYAFLTPRSDGRAVFCAQDLNLEESFDSSSAFENSLLKLHQIVYRRMTRDYCDDACPPITLTTAVDAPAGSGLGSSSALVVAMVDAFRAYLGLPLGQYDVAHLAWEIERIDLGLAGGKQDQYAAAFGGANFIEFLAGDRVVVNPLRVPIHILNEVESSLVVCYSGRSRDSSVIISQQTAAMERHSEKALNALHRLKQDAMDMKSALLNGRITEMAHILDRSWAYKKETASAVSNERLDQIYDLARRSGAIGGKVSGAGGGGFMMFMTTPENRLGLLEALNNSGTRASPVKFTRLGCETWQAPG